MQDRAGLEMRKEWREKLRREAAEAPKPAPLGDPGPYWRSRAETARAKVARDGTGRLTNRLRKLADTYEHLADRLAQKHGD